MSTPFKNILLIGATGSIGRYVLRALLAEPTFSITILQRSSSTTPLTTGTGGGGADDEKVRVITIEDDYPTPALVQAFRGQDAVISCVTTLSVATQHRFIDAAIAAGVRRYVPSEFGLNNMRADAQALNRVFRDKGAVQQYLRDKAAAAEIEWMSVSCGMWLKWSAQNNFLGMDIKTKGARKFVLWDGGRGRFSVTTEENTALAIVRALTRLPEETKNRNVLVHEFVTTQRELLEELKRQTGEEFVVEEVDSEKRIKELQAMEAAGDPTGTFGLIEAGFATGRYGGDLEHEGEILTDKLGLQRHSLEEVVADALASLQ
ncbi:uncharacterized protein B0T15DRAFT_484907 [Chaetomium strumarium]|uniref:NmrA-like domain-containing protein n=1 Tax=Chaetomium strumarium TaxID=1170767 RepID=A0AAJ0GSS5_9PEZI|nr:hypothetical protein B0T15DRAFT_484907 [Chaetomium strumarium]